tara:strand:+ start:75 stop:281 length:207 start_codon:yes stop_codon:yes gene_type:complete
MSKENSNQESNSNELYTVLGVVDSNNKKVLICNNCKDIWIAPKDRCGCGSTTLTETHPSNYKFAQNYA